mgnify:CR=1 FL=1
MIYLNKDNRIYNLSQMKYIRYTRFTVGYGILADGSCIEEVKDEKEAICFIGFIYESILAGVRAVSYREVFNEVHDVWERDRQRIPDDK